MPFMLAWAVVGDGFSRSLSLRRNSSKVPQCFRFNIEAYREEFQGRTMQKVGPEIRAKPTWEAMADFLKKVRAEQAKREDLMIDERLLKEVSIALSPR